MATENDNVKEQLNAEANGGMKTFTFKFKIDARKFAANFGVDVPDDSADETLEQTQDCGVREAVAEDADVNFDIPNVQRSSLYGQCAATLAQCKAKNPMTCPYHGMKAVAGEIEGLIRSAGVNGKVTCTIDDVNGGQMSVTASVVAAESDEKAINDAMKSFFKMPGVIQGSDMFYDDADKNVSGIFEIDSLDPKAQARWAFGAATPTTQQQAQPQPQPQQPTQQPVQQPVAQPQPTPTSSAKTTRTRTRKRAKPKSATAAPVETTTAVAEAPNGQGETVAIDLPGEDDPVLYPNEKPPKPPDYKSPFTDAELDSLDKMMVRLDKTARQINRNIEKNNTDAWLAKTAPNLPKSLQKFKNEVDGNLLDQLATKDTDGQVKAMKDLYDAIVDSEANGWKKKVAEDKWSPNDKCWWDKQGNDIGNVDIKFDRSKYDDPYAKERAAYEEFTPGSDGRKRALDSLKQIDDSKQKNAPKDAADKCRKAEQDMSDIEDAFDLMKIEGIEDDDLKKALGQAYYKANEEFKDGEKTCKEWLGKQSVMQDTIDDTIKGMKERGEKVPDEMKGWQAIEDQFEDSAWRVIARRFGFNVKDKAKHMEFFKKNMSSYLTRCPVVSYYHANHVKTLINGADAIHANTNSYVSGAVAAFGVKWARHSSAATDGMHTYAKVHGKPLVDIYEGDNYQGCSGGVGVLYNPKKAIISYVNAYLSSASAVSPHNGSCSPTFARNPNCNGVSCGYYGGQTGQISKDAFTEDLSNLDFKELHSRMGLTADGGEAWGVGGISAKQTLAILDYSDKYSKDDIKKFNALGVTILNSNGKIVGEDLIPDDDLRELVFGSKKRRS